MTTKKSTTKKRAPDKGAQGKPARQDSTADLARLISAVLRHPETPVNVYNDLADALSSLEAPKGYSDSAEYIEAQLRMNKRKGGRAHG